MFFKNSKYLFFVIIITLVCASCGQIIFSNGCCENRSIFLSPNDSANSAGTKRLEYYDDHLADKIYTLNKIKEQNRIDYSYAFITDLHWNLNIGNSPYLIKKIHNATSLDKIVLGGDYVDRDYEDDSIPKQMMKNCCNSFSFLDYKAIVGNHDTNQNASKDTPRIPDNEIFSIINNTVSEYAYSVEYLEDKHICSLYLNSGLGNFDDEQKKFVYNSLIELDETWTVLLFIHIVFDGTYHPNNLSVIRPVGVELSSYLSSIYPYLKCKLAGVFSGHSHLDYLDTTSYCCPFITTMCDAFGAYVPEYNIYKRELGKYTEQAFDIVQVDLTNHKVFLTRIGAGHDRYYTY